jgi:predicted SAM-dependent methyltransferase
MESEPMKLELGGGDFNRGGDWTNMDLNPVADIVHDLESFPYPQADESVDELYSSHCLEHLVDPIGVMNEISRICKVGARVEIRVPHPNSNHAMCAGHKHVFGPMVVQELRPPFPASDMVWTAAIVSPVDELRSLRTAGRGSQGLAVSCGAI